MHRSGEERHFIPLPDSDVSRWAVAVVIGTSMIALATPQRKNNADRGGSISQWDQRQHQFRVRHVLAGSCPDAASTSPDRMVCH